MAKTIRIIDLLNKIANGEEVPKKIKYKDFEYTYAKEIGWYRRIDDIGSYEEWFISKNRLNDTVEIIEEQQDIDIQNIEELPNWITRRDGEVTQQEGKRLDMAEKINQLVQAVKQLDNNKQDKE